MKRRIIPIFVPHRGCPHDCIFCNQKKITGISTDVTSEDARNIIEEYLQTMPEEAHIEIAFFGGSFTAIDINIQRDLLSVAKEYVEKGVIQDIRMSTRPDCIDKEILTMLKEYRVSIIELGVQSLDEDVLRDSIRGHNAQEVFESAKLIKEFGIELGLQMMVGLPSDSEEKCIETAHKFITMNPDYVRIYPTIVVKETGLENLLDKDKYTPFTLEESVQIVKKVLVLFYINNINVIRVGLQSTEDIQVGKAILAGPYHPAFRELVESELIKDYLSYIIKENDIKSPMIVKVNKKLVSRIIGNKKSNVIYIKEAFGVDLKTKECDNNEYDIEILCDDKEFKINIVEMYNKLYKQYML